MRSSILAAVLVFVSYSHKDIEVAVRAKNILERAGCEVWIDHKIKPGADWAMEIERQIDRADIVLAVTSKHSYLSFWVRAELMRANRKGKRTVALLVGEPDIPLPIEPLLRIEMSKLQELCTSEFRH